MALKMDKFSFSILDQVYESILNSRCFHLDLYWNQIITIIMFNESKGKTNFREKLRWKH